MGRRSLLAGTFVYVDELADADGDDEGDEERGERRLHLTVRHMDLEAAPGSPICGGVREAAGEGA